MLKLKVGQNFLLTNYAPESEKILYYNLAYMMSCFQGTNKFLVSADFFPYPEPRQLAKTLEETHAKEIFLLTYFNLEKMHNVQPLVKKREIASSKDRIQHFISDISNFVSGVKIKVINVNAYENKREFQFSLKLLKQLKGDANSILSMLPVLDSYKELSTRLKNIPVELKIIENDIRKLNQTTKVCEYVTTLKSLDYLNLIEKAEIQGTDLLLQLKPLPIYPSEPLGKVFEKNDFIKNPYLYKAASYIYRGCHFKAGASKIMIDGSFRLHFISTIDNTYDRMFRYHNWSGPGYPHFGSNGFCAGEFNDTMAHGKEYGLGYYFISLKQYLTTANMRDLAGYKVWWYPIYDDNDNLVYCAGMDILLEEYIKREYKEKYLQLKDLSWDEKVKALSNISFDNNYVYRMSCGHLSYYNHPQQDSFIELVEEKDPELYEEIMKGRRS